jgi:uncharacterized protein
MSEARGADYRTSAVPAVLDSTCLLCGNDGEAGKACATCAVAMPRVICSCGELTGVAVARCPRCSASLDGGEPHAYACPRCASQLTVVGIDLTTNVQCCEGCHGLFVPARAWHLLMGREDLVASLTARLPTTGERTRTDPRLVGCPQCSAEMDRMRFAATSKVVIDVCPQQHGVWLDAGELSTATDYARHRREIGAEAAIAEAEARDRVRADLDPARLQHQLAHELALQARERGVMATPSATPAPESNKLMSLVVLMLMLIALYFVYSFTFGARHVEPEPEPATPAARGHQKSLKALE